MLKKSVFSFTIIIFTASLLFFLLKDQTPFPAIEEVKIIPAENFTVDEKLQAQTDALLPLFDKMPSVRVFIKDEIINKEGSNTERGVAYTTCESPDQPIIFLKKAFFQNANQKQLTNILKHELTHVWLCLQNLMTVGHDEKFREKFKQVGGFGK